MRFRGVFWQPFDCEPVFAGGKGRHRDLADVNRPIVFDQHDLFEMRHEVAAALGRTGMDDQFPSDMIKRAQHCHFLGLT
jgi:hypothetical protein